MPQSLANVLVHVTFSTFQRAPLLTPDIREELFPFMAATLRADGAPSLQVGGYEDHVHALFRMSRTKTLASTIGEVKSSSSRWLKTKGKHLREFAWQEGYAAFSVSQSDAESVVRYIQGQVQHHGVKTFQDELRALLEAHQIVYDERYLWE